VPDGKWRFLRPGETVVPGSPPGAPGQPGRPGGPGGPTGGAPGVLPPGATSPGSTPGTRPIGDGGPLGSTIQGVASRSTDKGLRIFNGRERYSEWLFIPGQPRVIGRPMAPVAPGILPTRPGATPAPSVPRTP
jgi:hypothetical protein